MKGLTGLRSRTADVVLAFIAGGAIRVSEAVNADARGPTYPWFAILLLLARDLRHAASVPADLLVGAMRVVIAIDAAPEALIAPLAGALIGSEARGRDLRRLHLGHHIRLDDRLGGLGAAHDEEGDQKRRQEVLAHVRDDTGKRGP